MSSNRRSRQECRMRAIRQAEWRLSQRLETINWNFDVLEPEVAEFLGKATLPEPVTDKIVDWKKVDFVRPLPPTREET